MSEKDAEPTPEEILAAEKLLNRALKWRALPIYSPEERLVLAIAAASHLQMQRARGRKSKSAQKRQAEYRRNHVNLLLRYVVERKYRLDAKTAKSLKTVMKIVEWLDGIGIEASESMVRRDIQAALERGPLPTR